MTKRDQKKALNKAIDDALRGYDTVTIEVPFLLRFMDGSYLQPGVWQIGAGTMHRVKGVEVSK